MSISLILTAGSSATLFFEAEDFNLLVPNGSVILGIQLSVTGTQSNSGGVLTALAQPAGIGLKIFSLPQSLGTVILGGNSDLWGGNWISSNFDNSSFDFLINASNPTGGSITFTATQALCQIWYELPATTQCGVSVLLDEICGTFENLPLSVNDPPQLVPSSSVLSNRFYLSQGSTPPMCRHLQIKLDGDAAATKDEILAVTIRGALEAEQT